MTAIQSFVQTFTWGPVKIQITLVSSQNRNTEDAVMLR